MGSYKKNVWKYKKKRQKGALTDLFASSPPKTNLAGICGQHSPLHCKNLKGYNAGKMLVGGPDLEVRFVWIRGCQPFGSEGVGVGFGPNNSGRCLERKLKKSQNTYIFWSKEIILGEMCTLVLDNLSLVSITQHYSTMSFILSFTKKNTQKFNAEK